MTLEEPRHRISLEMGYTHSEFFRTLEAFMEGKPYDVAGPEISIPDSGRRVKIALSDERRRSVGPTLSLPLTPVEIAFFGYTEAEWLAFMERFQLIFRKGGG